MNVASTSNRQQVKEKIRCTALRMFHERGIRLVKMDDIAAALSMSKRTLYELYANKMELLEDVLELQFNMSRERMRRELKPNASTMDILILALKISIEEMRQTSAAFLDDLHRYPEAHRMLDVLEKRRDKETNKFFWQGVREGYFLPDVNYRLVYDIARTFREQTMFYRKDYDAREVWITLVRMLLRSVCTLKGIRELDDFLENKVKTQVVDFPASKEETAETVLSD